MLLNADEARRAALDYLASDKDTVRVPDAFGRLFVKTSHISKAGVNPYYGREIPGWQELGLDPNRVYKLLRDPEELAKSASTFNAVQVLLEHVPVSADAPQMDSLVGTTGTNTVWNDPYLDSELAIWTQEGIDLIESEERRKLSACYRYRPDMTPGVWNGEPHDGVMRDLIGNHVALVENGRAGPDVLVGDEAMKTARDAEFSESDHPRGEGGKFSVGEHRGLSDHHYGEAEEGGPQAEAHREAARKHKSAEWGILDKHPEAKSRSDAAHAATAALGAPQTNGPHDFGVEQRPENAGFAPGKWGVRTANGNGFLSYHDSRTEAKAAAAEYRKRAEAKAKEKLAGDGHPKEMRVMPKRNGRKAVLSRTAARAHGALMTYIGPMLAADKAIDLRPVLSGVNAANLKARTPDIIAGTKAAAVKAGIVFDADPMASGGASPDDVIMRVLDMVQGEITPEEAEADQSLDEADPNAAPAPAAATPEGEEGGSGLMALLKSMVGKTLDEAGVAALMKAAGGGAADEDQDDEDKKRLEMEAAKAKDEENKDMVTKEAMDAALKATATTIRAGFRAAQEAREAVRPWVGEVSMAYDSAPDIYRAALKSLNVTNVEALPDAALRPILDNLPKPSAKRATETVAMDAATVDSLHQRFAHMSHIQGA